MKPLHEPDLSGRRAGLKALLAPGAGDTRNGVVARTTRQMDPSTERQKSRKRTWPR